MAKKLYVGGLPYRTTVDDLKAYFSAAGVVEDAAVIIDKMTGRSRGFGFVTMTNDDEADAAIAKFNNADMDGRKILVNEARPMAERPPKGNY